MDTMTIAFDDRKMISVLRQLINSMHGVRIIPSDTTVEEEKSVLAKSFIQKAKDDNIICEKGIFGAKMDVELINDGPVTILLDSSKIL